MFVIYFLCKTGVGLVNRFLVMATLSFPIAVNRLTGANINLSRIGENQKKLIVKH